MLYFRSTVQKYSLNDKEGLIIVHFDAYYLINVIGRFQKNIAYSADS